jgi:hypothetical protein
MKRMLDYVSLLGCVIGLYFGAEKLGIFNTNINMLSAVYAVSMIYYGLFAYSTATVLGDWLVKKSFGYDAASDGRWSYYAAGESWRAPGFGFRLVLHAVFQAPLLYFGALFVRHLLF